MTGLYLTVQVPADEWAFVQGRVTYLEAMIVRIMREDIGTAEWFSAVEIAALRLPGLPASPTWITRRASAERWRYRRRRDEDGRVRTRYHVAGLPKRAFDALVARVLDLETEPDEPDELAGIVSAPPEPTPIASEPGRIEPPWVLPLVRLVKSSADFAEAWRTLPSELPPGVTMPPIRDAATTLLRLGLALKQLEART